MDEVQTIKARYSKRRATYQDVLDAPPHLVAELIDGELYTFPRPAPPNAVAQAMLLTIINNSFHGNGAGGWWIMTEPQLRLGENSLVPDIAGWRKTRMPKPPKTAYFEMAPDWLCEILSPSTRKIDLFRKVPIYAREAVSHLWILEPVALTVDAYNLCGGKWLPIDSQSGYATVSLPPFEAISFGLGNLWIDDESESKTVHKAVAGSDRAASP